MSGELEALIRGIVREEIAAAAAPAAPARLLTIDEARAAMGGIARSTIYQLITADPPRLRTVALGRRRFVPAAAIATYIAERSGP